MRNKLTVLGILLMISTGIVAQFEWYEEFRYGRFSRAIGMGSAYTAVAEGIEAVHYNSAGLAGADAYMFAYGSGYGIYTLNDIIGNRNYAFVLPINNMQTVGVSLEHYDFEFNNSSGDNYQYRLHYARQMNERAALGVSGNYYRSTSVNDYYDSDGNLFEDESRSYNSFDLSLSGIMHLDGPASSNSDKIQLGVQILNVFSTDVKRSSQSAGSPKIQTISGGIAYLVGAITGADSPVGLILACDMVFSGSDYNYNFFNFRTGLELSMFEVLSLRAGRQMESQIEEIYSFSPLHPVNRFGFGINLPLHKLTEREAAIFLRIDGTYSHWSKLDEVSSLDDDELGKSTISASLEVWR